MKVQYKRITIEHNATGPKVGPVTLLAVAIYIIKVLLEVLG